MVRIGAPFGGKTGIRQFLPGGKALLHDAFYPKDPKTGNRSFGPLLYGGLYSGGTYLFYPGNYLPRKSYKRSTTSLNLDMPGRNYSRTGKIRVWSSRFRKYIWVYPRRNNYYRRRY